MTAPADPERSQGSSDEGGAPLFDRHVVLDQLGGWRGMVDATLPTVAFIVANSLGGLRTGIVAALVAAVLVFLLRLVRRESLQQAVSGLFGVGIAVAIAAWSGQARDFFVLGIVRNTAIAAVLGASIAFRRPLVGYAAEFLSPSHLGALASASLPGTFGLRVVVQTPLYLQDEVGLLGTASLVLGLPVTAVALGVTFWAVSRLHRHRAEPGPRPAG